MMRISFRFLAWMCIVGPLVLPTAVLAGIIHIVVLGWRWGWIEGARLTAWVTRD